MDIKLNLKHLPQFPLLGLRSDGETFEYMIKEIGTDYIQIAIYKWFVNRTLLNIDEEVELLISNQLGELRDNKCDLGKITEINHNSAQQAIEYKLKFDVVPEQIPVTWSGETNLSPHSFHELLKQRVKDTTLLKSGVRIYYKHLNVYFSRISPFNPKEYSSINKALFQNIESHIKQNENKLKELHKRLEKNLSYSKQIPEMIDLEELREVVDSEISFPLFKYIFFESKVHKNMDINTLFKHPCVAYLWGIKTLERRLYLNYNMIVTIYSESL